MMQHERVLSEVRRRDSRCLQSTVTKRNPKHHLHRLSAPHIYSTWPPQASNIVSHKGRDASQCSTGGWIRKVQISRTKRIANMVLLVHSLREAYSSHFYGSWSHENDVKGHVLSLSERWLTGMIVQIVLILCAYKSLLYFVSFRLYPCCEKLTLGPRFWSWRTLIACMKNGWQGWNIIWWRYFSTLIVQVRWSSWPRIDRGSRGLESPTDQLLRPSHRAPLTSMAPVDSS